LLGSLTINCLYYRNESIGVCIEMCSPLLASKVSLRSCPRIAKRGCTCIFVLKFVNYRAFCKKKFDELWGTQKILQQHARIHLYEKKCI